MITPKVKAALLAALNLAVLATSLAVPAARTHAQAPARAATTDAAEEKRWLAVAPGRVEPLSGVIRVAVPVMGVIGEVLVRANDKVFAGEPLSGVLVGRWRELISAESQIVNLYGPTETTLAKCFYVVPPCPLPGVQPLGIPLPQTQVLVMGKE